MSFALTEFFEQLIKLIPEFCHTIPKLKETDFTRERKLPLPWLITTILHLVATTSRDGIDIKLGSFFKLSRRSHLLPEAQTPHRSTLTKARSKLSWESFANLLHRAVALAYQVFPPREEYTWHGLSVFAFDGSDYTLPATEDIRQTFDPDSGLDKPGKGHYPQALVNTAYDVFRRLPIARIISPIHEGNEREQALKLFPQIPLNSVSLFDRGYPSYSFVYELEQQKQGSRYFVIRCPAQSTFPAVESFVQSKRDEDIIWLMPSDSFKRGLTKAEKKIQQPIKLRIIRLNHPDGTVSVLLTNLFDKKEFPRHEIINLYYRRWAIENHYRTEKVSFDVERFHSKTVNGIRQELFAILIVCVIARVITALSVESESIETEHCYVGPQLKNAVTSFAGDIALLVASDPEKAFNIFLELLADIRRVKHYRPIIPKPSNPRINKQPLNKWQSGRRSALNEQAVMA